MRAILTTSLALTVLLSMQAVAQMPQAGSGAAAPPADSTPAPVPSVVPASPGNTSPAAIPDQIAPPANSDGPANGTPFSGAPAAGLPSGRGGAGTDPTPSLSK